MNNAKPMKSSSFTDAENRVADSIGKFETVMADITGKVEEASQKIQHMMDLGVRQKEEFMHLKEKAEDTVIPMIREGRELGRRLTSQARANQTPLLYGAAALVIGLAAFRYFSRERSANF